LVVGLWWGSGYLIAYTDDAYVDSDVVQVTPEVAGPIEAVDVRFRASRMRSAETTERARSCPTCHRQWIGSVSTGASRSACS